MNAGYFTISEEKIEKFKKKIIKLTYLTRKKPEKAVIKSINNQILGFGHYYKHASCKRTFEELDAFIRMRIRRYSSRNKDSKNRTGNLLLTNEVLKNLGLKSLLGIYQKYALGKKHIFRKIAKNKRKGGYCLPRASNSFLKELGERGHFYPIRNLISNGASEQRMILQELRKLTGLVAKLERRIRKIEDK